MRRRASKAPRRTTSKATVRTPSETISSPSRLPCSAAVARPEVVAEIAERVGSVSSAAELVGLVRHQVLVRLADDFALLAEGASDNEDVRTAGGEVSEGASRGNRLVVRVGVHRHYPVACQVTLRHG